MRIRLVALGLLLVAGVALAQSRPKPYAPKGAPPAAAKPTTPSAPRKPVGEFINGVADTGQFLPGDVVLARVGQKEIRVRDFVSAYFNSYPEFRPGGDSLGRAEFLASMVNKEVLGQTAKQINRPMGFEDRLELRTHTQRVLSNILFMRLVSDSVSVTSEDIARTYKYMAFDLHLRHILFLDPQVASRVRADILTKRITWAAAYNKHHRGPRRAENGDLGWATFVSLPPLTGLDIFARTVGEISEPQQDMDGFHLFQATESRPAKIVPEFNSVRTMIRVQLQNAQTAARGERVQSILRKRAGMVYDTLAITRFASRFQGSNMSMDRDQQGAPQLTINDTHPEFSPEDTATVLARWKDGRLTLSGLLHVWTDISPMARPVINNFEAMRAQVDGIALEPYSAVYAVELGLDKDSLALAMIEGKREEILVKHLFSDSVESKTWISKADRQKYYQEHPSSFTTYPVVEFAAISASRKSEADSVATRLRAGVDARVILREDSLANHVRGSIQSRNQNENGAWHKVLFEELRPGQVRVEGPDRLGDYLVLQLRSFDSGRLLPYDEVEGMIDESMQNIRQEEALNALLARARSRYQIESRNDLLMKIKLTDSTLDQ